MKMKAAEVVFSLAEVLLLIERGKKNAASAAFNSNFGEGRPDVVARLCMVVDWCIDHPEYTAKIKVIPKKDYPVLMPCEF
ncbi:hypothetical protein IKG73_03010 [Candidatus Saccharibacteria bacterium]|nr:hypothetical protein [Candidatus Saccharibacteria bacterium]